MPPSNETESTSLSFVTVNSKPITNKKNAMPISLMPAIISEFVTNPRTGPMIMPASIYPGIKGCFRTLAINPKEVASMISALNSKTKFAIFTSFLTDYLILHLY